MEEWRRVASTADRLREAMEDTGKKQVDLMRETGLNRGTISRYLSGEYEPKQIAVQKLAVALDVSEVWLWGYDVPKERKKEEKPTGADGGLSEEMQELIDCIKKLPEDKIQMLLQVARSIR